MKLEAVLPAAEQAQWKRDGRATDVLLQTDWDWPLVANTFGWSTEHRQGKKNRTLDYDPHARHWDPDYPDACPGSQATDGTVDCPVCKKTASSFIEEAREYLDQNDGAEAEDTGYFNE
jgi:hypothetical protein